MVSNIKIGPGGPKLAIFKSCFSYASNRKSAKCKIGPRGPILMFETIFPLKITFAKTF